MVTHEQRFVVGYDKKETEAYKGTVHIKSFKQ